MDRTVFSFPSADGESRVSARLWQSDDVAADPASAVAVIQLIHGMAEHIGRYDEFAAYLACQGFIVCGHDHIGHGATAGRPDRQGVIPADEGAKDMVEDVNGLRVHMQRRFGEAVPYFMFGHSMGSLVLRVYLGRYGKGLAGAVICGTANEPHLLAGAGNVLARAVSAVRGEKAKSPLLHNLADGAYGRRIPDARTPYDWLAADESVVDGFIADEDSGFMFSAGAYATLTELAFRATDQHTLESVPKDLPVLFIAGDGDPVGDFGRGVTRAADALRAAGVKDVDLIIYPGVRHEILNDFGHEGVFEDTVRWIDHCLQARRHSSRNAGRGFAVFGEGEAR